MTAIASVVAADNNTTAILGIDPQDDGLYRLLVCGSVEDLVGKPLSGGGQVLDFRVDQSDLLANGHFNHCGATGTLAPWTPTAPDPADVAHSVTDSQT